MGVSNQKRCKIKIKKNEIKNYLNKLYKLFEY